MLSSIFAPVRVQTTKGECGINAEIERRIGQNIRSLRERARMTQEQVAAKLQLGGCDITRSALAKIEVGQRHLYPDEIILLREILNVTYEEIFCTEQYTDVT